MSNLDQGALLIWNEEKTGFQRNKLCKSVISARVEGAGLPAFERGSAWIYTDEPID